MQMIAPNTDIILCKGVNIDRNYTHTLRSNNLNDQYNKIIKYKKRIFPKNTYQRTNEGKLRIEALADDLYDCNYLIFQNKSFGTKYFYAFIDSIDYINNNCTEISYTIDVLQTWMFDFKMMQSFVEREHSATDKFGENVIEENLGSGDLTIEQIQNFNFTNDYTILVYYIPQFSTTKAHKSIVDYFEDIVDMDGIETGYSKGVNADVTNLFVSTNSTTVGYHVAGFRFKSPSYASSTLAVLIDDLVKGGQDRIDGGSTILAVIQVPTDIFTACVNPTHQAVIDNNAKYSNNTSIKQNKDFKYKNKVSSVGYIPKNNKMYQYPYRQLMVTNNTGNTATYKWEDFKYDRAAGFEVQGTILPSAEVLLIPTEYRNLSKDYTAGLNLSDFINIPWSEDSYAKWWNQNKNGIAFGMLSSAVSTIGSISSAIATGGASEVITAGAISGTASAGSSILRTIGQIKDAKNIPDQLYGQFGTSALRLINNKLGYTFYDMGTDGETAETIDNYFTMFGYATKRVKIPNLFATDKTTGQPLRRPHYNYIKTNSCVIHPSGGINAKWGLNAADEEKICSIFDNGITFWDNLEEVGDYSVDNSPTFVDNDPIPTPTPVEPEPIPTPNKYNYPFKNITSFKMTQGYNSTTATGGHQGYDLVGYKNGFATNIQVASIAEGKVTHAGPGTGSYASYGNYVEIEVGNLLYHYAHLAVIDEHISIGAKIPKGTVLGIMGNTGNSTGTHLHLDIRNKQTKLYINPVTFTNIPNIEGAVYYV